MENKTCSIRGVVTRKLYDKEGNPLKMFQENKFWEFLKSKFNLDLKIPFLTGVWTTDPIVHNEITNAGLAAIANLISGENSEDPFTYLAIGVGTASSAGLDSEITTGGGERAAAAMSTVETTVEGDTAQAVHEWTFSDSFAITEEGWFNDASAGTMIAFRNFSAVNVESGNKFEVTHQIVVAPVGE